MAPGRLGARHLPALWPQTAPPNWQLGAWGEPKKRAPYQRNLASNSPRRPLAADASLRLPSGKLEAANRNLPAPVCTRRADVSLFAAASALEAAVFNQANKWIISSRRLPSPQPFPLATQNSPPSFSSPPLSHCQTGCLLAEPSRGRPLGRLGRLERRSRAGPKLARRHTDIWPLKAAD